MSSDSAEESQPSVTSDSNVQGINMLNVYKLIYTVAKKYYDHDIIPQKFPYLDEARTDKLGEPFINDEYWQYAEWENVKFQMAKAIIGKWFGSLPDSVFDDERIMSEFVIKAEETIQNCESYTELVDEVLETDLTFEKIKIVLQQQFAKNPI